MSKLIKDQIALDIATKLATKIDKVSATTSDLHWDCGVQLQELIANCNTKAGAGAEFLGSQAKEQHAAAAKAEGVELGNEFKSFYKKDKYEVFGRFIKAGMPKVDFDTISRKFPISRIQLENASILKAFKNPSIWESVLEDFTSIKEVVDSTETQKSKGVREDDKKAKFIRDWVITEYLKDASDDVTTLAKLIRPSLYVASKGGGADDLKRTNLPAEWEAEARQAFETAFKS